MMHCDEVRDQLGRWYDNELDGATAHRVEEHLAGCAACAEQVESWRQIDGLLQIDVDAEGLRTAVLAAIRLESASGAAGLPWWLRTAAAALVAAGLGGLCGWAAGGGVEASTTQGWEVASLSLLEQSFAPGSLAGIDDLAVDLASSTAGGRR